MYIISEKQALKSGVILRTYNRPKVLQPLLIMSSMNGLRPSNPPSSQAKMSFAELFLP
jgi:hypothetical protein